MGISGGEVSFFVALLAGLFTGVHCIGMCGGIVSGLSIAIKPTSKFAIFKLNLTYNFGRITSYVLAGLVAGGVGLLLGKTIFWFPAALNIFASLVLIALGLYLMGATQTLKFAEQLGSKLWKYIQPIATKFYPFQTVKQALIAGILWGFLPCGPVYAALVTFSMASGSPITGGWYMLGFGLGTLPTLLTIGLFAHKVKPFIQSKAVRFTSGGLIVAYGLFRLTKFIIKMYTMYM